MRIVIYLIFFIGFNSLLAQDFTARWHCHIQSDRYDASSFCPDDEKGLLAAFKISSKMRLGDQEYVVAASERAVLASFDSFGRCLWQKPVLAAGSIMPLVCRMMMDDLYMVAITSGNKSYWALDGDTFYGSGVLGMNRQGTVNFVKPMPGSVASSPVPCSNGKFLIKCDVVKADTVEGVAYSAGFWVIEMDGEGSVTRRLRLGMSQSAFSEFDVVANDTAFVFSGDVARDKPFIGNGWQVRALDSLPRPGGNKKDLFVACLNNQGQLNWMYRIDTMSYGAVARSMVLLANGKIIWTPNYHRTGTFLGQNIRVRFPGGRYHMYAEINIDGGVITRFRAAREVGGGSENGLNLFTDDKFNNVMITSQGGDSTGVILGLSPAQWQAANAKLLYFNADMNYRSQAAIPGFISAIVNAHKTNHMVYPTYFPYGSLGSTMLLDGVTYTNRMGTDFMVGNYTTEKFTKLASVNKLNGGELMLYPNPAQHQFMVLNKQDNWKTVSVFDAQGRNCGALQAENGKWNIGHLLPGMYMLQFEGDAGTRAWSRLLISR